MRIFKHKAFNSKKRLRWHYNTIWVEMMAICKILGIIKFWFLNEHGYIYPNCLNYLYLLNTIMKYSTLYISHLDQIFFASMVQLLQSRT